MAEAPDRLRFSRAATRSLGWYFEALNVENDLQPSNPATPGADPVAPGRVRRHGLGPGYSCPGCCVASAINPQGDGIRPKRPDARPTSAEHDRLAHEPTSDRTAWQPGSQSPPAEAPDTGGGR
jgi:hypothetical protein